MKAVVQHEYGPAERVLSVEDIPTPKPAAREVLVRVRAASMHPDIWHVVEGTPLALRLFGNGLRRPSRQVPGTDLAGRIEAVGDAVTRFRVGDDVFGETVPLGWLNGGAYAEYAVVAEDMLVLKPDTITYEQAAAVPASGFIALSNIGLSRSFEGMDVLINGGGGCVGMFAIQMARAKGAVVTAVDCASRLDLMRSLGATHVIDYARLDVTQQPERYDFIMDVASTLSHGEYRRILKPDGVYVPIGHAFYGKARGRMGGRIVGSLPYFIGQLVLNMLNPRTRNSVNFPTKQEAMATMKALIETGALTPRLGRTYGLPDVAEAMRAMQDTSILGRIVIVP